MNTMRVQIELVVFGSADPAEVVGTLLDELRPGRVFYNDELSVTPRFQIQISTVQPKESI